MKDLLSSLSPKKYLFFFGCVVLSLLLVGVTSLAFFTDKVDARSEISVASFSNDGYRHIHADNKL